MQTQVLDVALRGLGPAERRTLHVIAGFRTPTSMEALKALLIRRADDTDPRKVPYATLTELEDLQAAIASSTTRLIGLERVSRRVRAVPGSP